MPALLLFKQIVLLMSVMDQEHIQIIKSDSKEKAVHVLMVLKVEKSVCFCACMHVSLLYSAAATSLA